jgi:hypothetical protein
MLGMLSLLFYLNISTRSDKIGDVNLPLSAVAGAPGQLLDSWLKLKSSTGREVGEIHVVVKIGDGPAAQGAPKYFV